MTHRRASIATVAVALSLHTAPGFGQQPVDEPSIRGLATQFERAWNSHDLNLLRLDHDGGRGPAGLTYPA
jgi:hypothetical protein